MSATEETTKLPSGWKRGISQTLNRPYYYHPDSKHTQWHYPTPAEAADPIATKAKMMEERHQKKRSNKLKNFKNKRIKKAKNRTKETLKN